MKVLIPVGVITVGAAVAVATLVSTSSAGAAQPHQSPNYIVGTYKLGGMTPFATGSAAPVKP